MEVTYLLLIILFMVGLFQWFWMFPRLSDRGDSVQTLNLADSAGNTRLFSPPRETYDAWRDEMGKTPFERVIREME